MAFYTVDGDDLSAIADKIRAKKNISTPIEFPDGFVNGINSIYASIDYTTLNGGIRLNSGTTFRPGELVDLTTSDTASYIYAYMKCSPIINYTIEAVVSPSNMKSKLIVFLMLNSSDNKYHVYILNTHTSNISISVSGNLRYSYRVYKASLD